MSIISTEHLNASYKKMQCLKYNVEDIEFDYEATYIRQPDVTETNVYKTHFLWVQETHKREVKFYGPVMKWKIDGVWYTGPVPVHLSSRKTGNLIFTDYEWIEDQPEMERELIEMIERSRKHGADEYY